MKRIVNLVSKFYKDNRIIKNELLYKEKYLENGLYQVEHLGSKLIAYKRNNGSLRFVNNTNLI